MSRRIPYLHIGKESQDGYRLLDDMSIVSHQRDFDYGIAIVLFRLVKAPNTPAPAYIEEYIAASHQAAHALSRALTHSPYHAYQVLVPYESNLYKRLRTSDTIVHPMKEYPQIAVYASGVPYAYFNGDLTDEDELHSLLTEVEYELHVE